MRDVVSVEVMRKSDEYTIKSGTESRELMRRAGEAIYKSIDWNGKVAIVCGGGNNAGDGYVLASFLGAKCRIFLIRDKFSADGAFYFNECLKMGIGYTFIDDTTDFGEYDIIVDCIFGTGFKGELKGAERDVIRKINQSGKMVVSCDIPSGLNGDTGMGESVISDVTISIGTIKTGLILNCAKDRIKKLINCPIGIEINAEKFYLADKEDFVGKIPNRLNHSHKGSYGYTAILGGCEEYSGAIKLCNMSLSALKAGCGVNKIIVSESLCSYVAPYVLESTVFKMSEKNGKMCFDEKKINEVLGNVKAVAIGMGWGKGEEYDKILSYILEKFEINVIIDADGINTLSQMDLNILKKTKCRVCLTPHLKEFSRLTKKSMDKIDIYTAKEFAKEYNVVLLLKGTATTVTDGDKVLFVNRGCVGMATAGSGDVLSGILCGLAGYMDPDINTVAMGAYMSGRAGEIAQRKVNEISMVASDTVNAISDAISELV